MDWIKALLNYSTTPWVERMDPRKNSCLTKPKQAWAIILLLLQCRHIVGSKHCNR